MRDRDLREGGSRPSGFSRRSFLKGASVAAVGTGLATEALADAAPTDGLIREDGVTTVPKGALEITLRVNGEDVAVTVEPRTTLLDALRDRAGLTGTKKVCDRGACGACTLLLDGKPANSCLTLAWDAVGREITTIEGLADGENLHPVQQAFVECDALQCGFCTPGMVMSSVACLQKHATPTPEQIRHELSGNICRCGTYGRVFEAVANAAKNGGGR